MRALIRLNCTSRNLLLLAVIWGPAAVGQSGTAFQMTKQTMDSGGGNMSTAQVALSGTIGQQEASVAPSSSENFSLAGGFWAEASESTFSDVVFASDFENEFSG